MEDFGVTELSRGQDLWFSDGSLVVRAEDTIFRVSGAVLAARSSVFQDMLSFPQPSAGQSPIESIEGMPIVVLYDRAAEVEPFLRAIFDSSSFMPPPSTAPLSDILAVLRLSHKYDIQYLHRRALDHLSMVFPTELSMFLPSLNYFPEGFQTLKTSGEAHLQILRVVHEVNALWLLPAVYSRASTCLPKRLFVAPSWPELHVDIKNKLHTAHAHHARYVIAIVHCAGPDAGCTAPETCSSLILSVITALLEQIGDVDMEFNFFDVKDLFLPGLWAGFDAPLCAACVAHTAAQVSVGVQKVWDALPANLGLPPWDELGAMRRAAMG
ncbi:hypothetical protein B0H17DRAFT_1190165 [Mycena rosella]|uniref:BTB domain-containing protein n=1 Tax=Mycena rosella TaxID=1033263 RepID=A0AAD7H2K4_MYCRO|nr:hypothetical protein B0H17DRAFT_1190165 [Mycena rosella]